MNSSFDHITTLQYRLKAAERKLQALESGEKYVSMKKEMKQMMASYEKIIKGLKEELEQSHREIIRVREYWFDVLDMMEKEFEKALKEADKKYRRMEERALRAEGKLAEAQDKITEQRRENYALKEELEEEKGKNLKLTAQLNHDYENSSIPSSMTMKKKKIQNSREKTGRKPGGQPGHPGHCRKKQEPTAPPIILPPSQEILNDSDFRKTGKIIKKQKVSLRMCLVVQDYYAEVYYNSKTGERYHAPFPEGVVDDVNYDGSVRAFLYLLNNDCCVSIDKSRRFLSDLTDGKLNISKGMINKLNREFASKTEAERKQVFQRLLMSPVMHIDCTNARVNGENRYVFVCSAPGQEAMYFAREKKGHEGVKGTPAEDYQGIIVQDHESTFYRYGSDHQECLAHVLRALKDSIANEPGLTWNKKMQEHLREMIHYRNSLEPGKECGKEEVEGFRKKYTEILQKAKEEYEYEPASDYYKDGYNLYLRMEKYMENHLLFLKDMRVPPTNNEAERLGRNYKRKQKQAVTLRSNENFEFLCAGMSVLLQLRQKEENVYHRVTEIFESR